MAWPWPVCQIAIGHYIQSGHSISFIHSVRRVLCRGSNIYESQLWMCRVAMNKIYYEDEFEDRYFTNRNSSQIAIYIYISISLSRAMIS
jgi:hypothetical protein